MILTPVEKVYRADETNNRRGNRVGSIRIPGMGLLAEPQQAKQRHQRIPEAKSTQDGTKFKKAAPGWLEWNEETKDGTVKPGAKETITFVFKSVVSVLARND